MVSNRSARFVALSLTVLALASAAACAPAGPDPDSERLEGADEDAASSDQGLSGSFPVGTVLVTTAGLNLRSGASTSSSVRHVVPEGARVIVQQSSPSNGFYKVKHNGTLGWNHGGYLEVDPESANDEQSGDDGGDDADDGGKNQGSTRAAAMNRAKASEGFSYWWGHGRFRDSGATSSTRGSCSGSCPSCSHSGQYGVPTRAYNRRR